jgi:monoamine oxidase
MIEIKRRLFLKAMLLAGAATAGCGGSTGELLMAPVNSSNSDLSSEVDVAIIGAGAAGLSAAQVVRAAGRSMVVLEARDRVGGRCTTDNTTFASMDFKLDLGGQFFHQSKNNPMLLEAQRQGVYVFPDFGGRTLYSNGAPATDLELVDPLAMLAAVTDAVFEAGLAASLGAPDISTLEAIADFEGLPFYGFAAATVVNSKTTVEITELNSSLDWYNFFQLSPLTLLGQGDDFFIPSGMGNFLRDTYATGLPISLQTPVTTINWGAGSGVSIETNSGTVRAKTVIITVPTNVLRAGGIRFNPPLPDEYQTAIDALPMGAANKIALAYNSDVFGTPDNSYAGPLTDGPSTFSLVKEFGQNVSVTFIEGERAAELEQQGTEVAVDFALELLSGIFGNQVRQGYSGVHRVTSWFSDPFSQGSWGYARPGQAGARLLLLDHPVADQLLFAGEAISRDSHGSLNGAFSSGQHAGLLALGLLTGAPLPRRS